MTSIVAIVGFKLGIHPPQIIGIMKTCTLKHAMIILSSCVYRLVDLVIIITIDTGSAVASQPHFTAVTLSHTAQCITQRAGWTIKMHYKIPEGD